MQIRKQGRQSLRAENTQQNHKYVRNVHGCNESFKTGLTFAHFDVGFPNYQDHSLATITMPGLASNHEFSCFCKRTYPNQKALEEHRKARGHPASHQCIRSCKHTATPSHDGVWRCGACDTVCERLDIYEDHLLATGHCFCKECKIFFRSKAALRDHLKTVIHATEFRCCDCNKSFKHEAALLLHMTDKVHKKRKRKETVNLKSLESTRNKRCNLCNAAFKSTEALEQHLSSLKHKPISKLACPSKGCSRKSFSSPAGLLHHLEGGTCKSGLNRSEILRLVQSCDTEGVVHDRSMAARLSPSIASPSVPVAIQSPSQLGTPFHKNQWKSLNLLTESQDIGQASRSRSNSSMAGSDWSLLSSSQPLANSMNRPSISSPMQTRPRSISLASSSDSDWSILTPSSEGGLLDDLEPWTEVTPSLSQNSLSSGLDQMTPQGNQASQIHQHVPAETNHAPPLRCPLCPKTQPAFVDRQALQAHLKHAKCHRNTVQTTANQKDASVTKNPTLNLRCPLCPNKLRTYVNQEALQAHIDESRIHKARNQPLLVRRVATRQKAPVGNGTPNLRCPLCPNKLRVFINQDALAQHMKQLHTASGKTAQSSRTKTANTTAPLTLRCHLCPPQRSAFKDKIALQQHMESPRHSAKLYHCPTKLSELISGKKKSGQAVKKFSTLSGLTQHLEAGACAGGKKGFKLCIELIQGHLERLGFKGLRLIT